MERVPGIGPALAARLARRGIATRAQLLRHLDELPPRARAHLRWGVTRRVPAELGDSLLAAVRRSLTFEVGGRRRRLPTRVVGSARRRRPASRDLDLLVVVPDALFAGGLLASGRLGAGAPVSFAETYAVGSRRRSTVLAHPATGAHCTLDLFLARESELPYALLHYTGGKEYNIRLRAHAKRLGYVLNQYGLFLAGSGRRAPGTRALRSEKEVVARVGATYLPPPERP